MGPGEPTGSHGPPRESKNKVTHIKKIRALGQIEMFQFVDLLSDERVSKVLTEYFAFAIGSCVTAGGYAIGAVSQVMGR